MDSLLPMPNPYLGSESRNHKVPWSLQSSVAGFLAFEKGFTSLTPNRAILRAILAHLLTLVRMY